MQEQEPPPTTAADSAPSANTREDREFRPWLLSAWLLGVIVALALVAALIDVLVLGW